MQGLKEILQEFYIANGSLRDKSESEWNRFCTEFVIAEAWPRLQAAAEETRKKLEAEQRERETEGLGPKRPVLE